MSVRTMNGSALSRTYRRSPRAIRRRVFSARGFFRPKIDGHGTVQSMHSAAVRNGSRPRPWVGSGQTMGRPSDRATTKSRFRVVGAP
jgi:hypothetical protein